MRFIWRFYFMLLIFICQAGNQLVSRLGFVGLGWCLLALSLLINLVYLYAHFRINRMLSRGELDSNSIFV